MAERTTLFEVNQIGVEVTPGTPVAANKLLQALSIAPAIQFESNTFRPMGTKFPTIVAPSKEWVEAGLTGYPTYDEIVYPLSSILSYAAPTLNLALSYTWTFNPGTTSPSTVKTFTVEQGSSVRAHKFAYGIVRDFGLRYNRGGIELSGAMLGAALTDGITLTGSPTTIPLIPVLPTEVDVKLADTQAGLTGASALTRVIEASWNLTNRHGPIFPLATQYGVGFATTVETEPTLEATLKLEADAAGMGLLTNMRAGSTKFMRIQAIGATIETTYDYTLQVDLAGKVSSVSEFSDEDGLYAIEWTFTAVVDSTWGQAFGISVINTLSDV